MNASSMVIEEILVAFEESDQKGVQTCLKFAKRYHKDHLLQKASRLLSDYDNTGNEDKLIDGKKLLDLINDSRQFQTMGGHGLAVKDRRRFKSFRPQSRK